MKHQIMNRTLTTKEVIQSIKEVYDTEGPNGCGQLFTSMLHMCDKNDEVRIARAVLFLTNVVYKMDTCTEDCFDGLESKKICTCNCNDEEMCIYLDSDGLFGEA